MGSCSLTEFALRWRSAMNLVVELEFEETPSRKGTVRKRNIEVLGSSMTARVMNREPIEGNGQVRTKSQPWTGHAPRGEKKQEHKP